MPVETIVRMLDEELTRLQQVRSLLAATGKLAPTITRTLQSRPARRKRALSAEARRAIAEAQRRRWAAQKAKA